MDDYENLLEECLQNKQFASNWLWHALDEGVPQFLEALKAVIKVNGGTAPMAKKIGISRTSIHCLHNPRFSTICALLDALGLKITIKQRDDGQVK